MTRPYSTPNWASIAARLRPSRTYWLATVGRDGAPQVSPVWGAVVDDVWFGYSERRTVKARNLAVDARVVLHLGDPDDVVIVRGRLHDAGTPAARADVVATLDAKYTAPGDAPFLPSGDTAFDVLYELEPLSAMLWQLEDYENSQQRWASD